MKANRFRFRAWVNKEFDDGECHMVEGWLKDQCEWFQLNRNGQELMWGWNEECEEPLLVGRDVTLEFSTGLVDKNGKEEFEGDVVKILYTDWPSQPFEDPRSIEQYKLDISRVAVVEYFAPEYMLVFKTGKGSMLEIGRAHV